MNSTVILGITSLVLVFGGMAILLIGKHRTTSEGMQTVLHGIVPIIAAVSYFAMYTKQGQVILPTDAAVGAGQAATRVFYYARYIDWSVTTPLLLLSLGLNAMNTGKKRSDLLVGVVLADVLMIVTSFVFGASETGWERWSWFGISTICFLFVYYVIWGPQLAVANRQREDVRANYKRNAAILSVLWLVYPFVLAASPDGAHVIDDSLSVLLIAILDVLSKVAYGLITVSSDKAVTDEDLAHPEPEMTKLREPVFAN